MITNQEMLNLLRKLSLEKFDGIFIATTNLMDNLDKASLRRFNIKMEFKPLTPIQIEKNIYQLEISLM